MDLGTSRCFWFFLLNKVLFSNFEDRRPFPVLICRCQQSRSIFLMNQICWIACSMYRIIKVYSCSSRGSPGSASQWFHPRAEHIKEEKNGGADRRCIKLIHNTHNGRLFSGPIICRLVYVGNLPSEANEASLKLLFPDALQVIIPLDEKNLERLG